MSPPKPQRHRWARTGRRGEGGNPINLLTHSSAAKGAHDISESGCHLGLPDYTPKPGSHVGRGHFTHLQTKVPSGLEDDREKGIRQRFQDPPCPEGVSPTTGGGPEGCPKLEKDLVLWTRPLPDCRRRERTSSEDSLPYKSAFLSTCVYTCTHIETHAF